MQNPFKNNVISIKQLEENNCKHYDTKYNIYVIVHGQRNTNSKSGE